MSKGKTFKPVLGGGEGDGNITYIRAKELSENGTIGVVAEGIYEGTTPNNFDDSKNDYKVKLGDGKLAILNSTGSLRNQLEKVATGSYVRVSYKGMEAIKKGKMAGKSAHSFLVEVAE